MMGSIELRKSRAAVLLMMLLSFAVFLTGCSSVRAGAERISSTGLKPGDIIAVVPHPTMDTYNHFERSLGPCIQEELGNLDIGCRMVYLYELQKKVLCNLGQSGRPSCVDIMKCISSYNQNDRNDNQEIRYLVCISGKTCSTSPDIAGGGEGGFVVLIMGWDKYSMAEAGIYDIRTGKLAGSVMVRASDTGVVGIIPPFFIPAMTETKVCERFGKEIVRFLAGHELPSTEAGANEDLPVSVDEKSEDDICHQTDEKIDME